MTIKSLIATIAAGAIVFIGGCVIAGCISKVPTGYKGIVYDARGGVTGEVLDQGWHLVSPWKSVTEYSVGIEQSYLTKSDEGDSPHNDSFEVPTSDGKGIWVDLTFTYSFDQDRIAEIFTKFKGQDGVTVKRTFIKPKVISWAKEVTAKYPVTAILGEERANINSTLTDYLKEKFHPYGILINDAAFSNIEADATTAEAIQKKITAQQAQELAAIEAKTAKINADKEKEVAIVEAEKNKATAEINAEQARIKAQGEADATKIKAEAEAEAIRVKTESLTPEYIEHEKAVKWDGALPKIQPSDSSSMIFNVGDVLKESN